MNLSLVCQRAKDKPNAQHRPCTGCPCPCHDVPPPADFRALVEAARAGEKSNP